MLALWTTLIGIGLAGATIPAAASVTPQQVTPVLIVDGYALFYTGLLLGTSFIVSLLAYSYIEQRKENREEFYILLMLATLGAIVMVASSHFVSLFLGLEILSVGIYVLVAYFRDERLVAFDLLAVERREVVAGNPFGA